MYGRRANCYDCESGYRPGLGALPLPVAGAVGAVTTGISQTFNTITSALGLNSSDPIRDRERIARVDAVFAQARTGDAAAIQCLRDMAQGVYKAGEPPRTCALGSEVGARYAAAKWLEFQGREVAGTVGAGLIGQSNIPTRVVGAVTSTPVLLGAAALALFLFARRR